MIAVNKYFDSDQTALALAEELLKKGMESGNRDLYDNGATRFEAANDSIIEKGEEYADMIKLYCDAIKANNDYIDFHNFIEEGYEEQFVQNCRNYGFNRFTYSSPFGSPHKTIWNFVKSGCKLIGIAEITIVDDWFVAPKYHKIPAFILDVEEV